MPKKGINLLVQEEFEKKPLGKFLLWVLSTGRWIVVFTELIVILAFLARFKLDRDIADLYESIKQKQAIIASFSSFEKDFRFLGKRLFEVKNLEVKQPGTTALIEEISSITPPDVAFSSFSFSQDEMKIAGIALSEKGLGSFIAGLTSSSSFSDINLSNITQKAEDPGIRFSLTMRVLPKGGKNAI